MAKTITLRVADEHYNLFRAFATSDNRNLSNFIENATMQYIQEHEVVDAYEMDAIRSNRSLNLSLKRGVKDAVKRQGRFVD